ncbi:MAG: hypothetical protein P4M11_08380 [Candidatus Pacebacteria bacterium]|nr:hypothetical protein [Candidatus Paceibacterota bacterium]
MVNYERSALCCIMLLVIFAVAINVLELTVLLHQIHTYFVNYSGLAFDCRFYPMISRLVCVLFVAVASCVCLMATIVLIWFEDLAVGYVEKLFSYSLYLLFGPLMLTACFFFLLNYENYGYSCNTRLQKQYSGNNKALLIVLCFLSILITVLCCVKSLIRKLSSALRNNDNCLAKLVNLVIGTPAERNVQPPENEEARPLRAQL